MKHTLSITVFLVVIFFCAQIVGLFVINQYIDIEATEETGKTVVNKEAYDITGIQPPPVKNESTSWIFIIAAVLIGTVLVLIIIKFRSQKLWKLWFFASVIICLTVSFAPFIQKVVPENFALYTTLAITAVLTYIKVFRHNLIVHNLTEIFVYGGLASLIVPIINIQSAFLLLIAISIYDMFAVWRSKHMVSMAKFQTESKIFAGLMLSYQKPGEKIELTTEKDSDLVDDKTKPKSAILGGGDIAFPLLFSGAVMKMTASFLNPFIITVTASLALLGLLWKGKSNRFYPAMPFISAGCFVGYGIVLLLAL